MINVKVTEQVGTIILDRPQQCNALNRRMIEELAQAFDDLRQEKRVRGVILTGSGAHFCTGLDLKELRETALSEPAAAMKQWHDDAQATLALIELMLQLPKPIVAAVDGAAMGTGLALVLASDLVVASHRATLSIPSPRTGLVSGFAAPLLYFRTGAAVASQLLIGGSELAASEAKLLGLVQHVVEPHQIWARASTWIDSIAQGAAESVQLTKKLLNEMIGETLMTQLASGAAAMATAMTTEAAGEGLQAFIDKRAPSFPR
jgi:methylglutaconyl-CoA hydratase